MRPHEINIVHRAGQPNVLALRPPPANALSLVLSLVVDNPSTFDGRVIEAQVLRLQGGRGVHGGKTAIPEGR